MMRDLRKKTKHPDHVAFGSAGHGTPERENARMNALLSLKEVVECLKSNQLRLDVLGEPGNEYAVETTVTVSESEWFFRSEVKHNGKEVTDDIKLIQDELRRKRVTQANKTKALWSMFIKEAAEIHLEKCSEVKGLFKRPDKNHIRIESLLFIIIGSVLILSAVFGLYILYRAPVLDRPEPFPSTKPAAKLQLPPASSPAAAPPSQTTNEPKPSLPSAPAARMPDQPESSAIPLQRSSDLSPKEIREKVRKVLKSKPGYQ